MRKAFCSPFSIVLLALGLPTANPATAAGAEPLCEVSPGAFSVDDYFDVKRVTELAMASDGEWLLYVVEGYADEARVRDAHLVSLSNDITDAPAADLSEVHDFAWIPRSHELAYISRRSGVGQVFSRHAAGGEVRQWTQASDTVESYLFMPDGTGLALMTRASHEPGVSLYDRFRDGTEGILIDPATTSSHDFVNPNWHQMAKSPAAVLRVRRNDQTIRVPVPGEPSGGAGSYFWSEDGRYLSVTFVADDVPQSQMRSERTSMGVFDTATDDFRVIAKGTPPDGNEPAISYRGGEWIPGEHRLLIRRITETDPWVSDAFPDWTVADALKPLAEQETRWHPMEVYPRGLRFLPLSATKAFLTNTVRAVHSLFVLTPEGIERSDFVDGLDGSSSLFSFSDGYAEVAFVNESLRRPPEIYVARRGGSAEPLTALNSEMVKKLLYSRREVQWESPDGTQISGWLLEPQQTRPAAGWPMITHVHGGPAFPYPDAFAPYFSYWPYPLEVYLSHGVAVFLPNYRGTHTYGRSIAAGEDDEPIDDIISGVRYLVSKGVADQKKLGISGHSHGGIVGPLAMARSGIFEASSFAEGVSNSVVMYELMSGDANRQIHDPIMGASLYESPELYLKESPDLHLDGVDTAALFEAGAYVAAIHMLGFPKAAQRAGMPAEFIVYPQTGHNVVIPALQRESAERNLDWFNFWLKRCVASEPTENGRYQRWKALSPAND
jgi:dipeptidyl aminopeptidase/acylaminoacyl peptidase